jgi:membrane-associated HD superfamily phosphohydrolase
MVSPGRFSGLDMQQFWRLALPFSLAPLTLSVLLGRNRGLFAATFVSLWGSIIHRSIDARFLVISLITGFIAVFLTLQVRRRSRLIRAGLFVGFATWILALMFGWIGPIEWDSVFDTNWRMIGWQSLIAVGGAILTAFVVSGALPVFETVFGVTTDISWLELADLNHPLLKRMMIEAPARTSTASSLQTSLSPPPRRSAQTPRWRACARISTTSASS